MLILHETYDHWSVAVLTVTVHSSFFPTFDFFVAFCTGFNLLTPIFMLPCIIMDLLIFGDVNGKWLSIFITKHIDSDAVLFFDVIVVFLG